MIFSVFCCASARLENKNAGPPTPAARAPPPASFVNVRRVIPRGCFLFMTALLRPSRPSSHCGKAPGFDSDCEANEITPHRDGQQSRFSGNLIACRGVKKLRVGIIDLVAKGPTDALYARVMNANLASIMPQIVGVWSEARGHDVTYVCYTGLENLVEELPGDVAVVFICAFT